ncbi:unnamed protein product [Rotaria socialis]|uniref:Reverse transcriptase n=1 Tax=Rotaria socialis TaxID=392032 RepID=A0A821T7K7_9BILA|nr:unnamed protein product [Rotaria socialis]
MAPPVEMDAATKAMFDILMQNMTQMRLANEAQAERMEQLTTELALSRDNKLRFKVIEPVKYSLDSTIKLQDYFVTFEIFCSAQYGNANKDAWSAALGKFLEGDISQAYTGLEGGSMPWEDLKTTLAARFADTAQRTNKFLNLFNNLAQEKEAKAANSVVIESDPVANVQAAISLRPNSGATPRINCTHCNRPGHAQTSCWTLHPNLKPARSNNGNFGGRGNFNNSTNRGSYNNNNNRGGGSNNRGGQGNQSVIGRKCYACNEFGHMANMCPTRNRYSNMPPPASFQIRQPNATVFSLDKHCGACGARGADFHFFNSCPYVIEQQAQLASAAAAMPSIEQVMVGINAYNYKYRSLVDSGAEICLIGIKNVRKNHNMNEITNAGINVIGIGGSVKVHGRINLKVNISNEKSVFKSFVIVEDLANELLLGANFIRSNEFIIDMASEKLLRRLNKINNIAPKAISRLEPGNSNIDKVKSAVEDTNVSDNNKCNVNLINTRLSSKIPIVKETISNFNIKKVDNLNSEDKIFNIDYTNGGVRLIETINLKPQHSTIAAFDLDKKFKNNVNVFSVGVFPDKAILNDNLMIQSCVINSDCKNLVMPIMNCSDGMIQLKAGTIIAYAQKLVSKNNGELAEAGFEWCKKEVNASENKKSESFMEMFRMDEAKLTSDQNKKVEALLNKFSKCISLSDNDVGKTSTLSHSIKLTRDTAIKQPIRRINGELAEEVETQLQQLSDDGIIRPSNSPWSSCIVPVKKRCGGLRLAIDYRLLNNLTVKDSFPLPNLNDAVYNLHGSVFFSTLDLTRGYYNVPMDEDSIPLTAFSTSRSHWEFIRMPFGLCNAGATFQRLMNLVLRGFSWSQCICYIDDALVLGSTFEEHYNNLHNVLSCLSQHGLKIKPQKCHLFRTAVKFLGYEVSKNGIMPDKKNIEGITNFPRPTTVKNVRSFLGIVNFYRLHIPNCSIIQKPLSALTGKNKVLVWNDDAEKAFNKLKQLLVSPQLLAYPDYSSTEPLEVHVDSSLTGAGAVLSQKQLGVVRPIAFISTSWGVTEQNYASTARELAGLRWAVKKLAPFLRGREFVIHTDNQPLIFLSNTKCVSQRLARTLEDLSDFNFKVKWIPGHSNIVADALSRMHETISDSPRAKESLNILGESLLEIKMDGGGDSLVNALSFWLTGNISDSLNLRQKLVTELINNNKLYGLELNKVGKFELKIMLQEGINLIPEVIKAFSNLFNCKVIVFEKRRHPIEFGDDNLPKICYLNSHNSLHYNLLVESQVKPNTIIDPSPIILPEGRVDESVKNASVVINQGQVKLNFNKWTREEIQSMQRSNDLLRLLKTFISMYPPGNNRIMKWKLI